eukprot:542729-Prymnesium_polylepis.1
MMTGLMLWMSGNGVHIFSIMITFYAIYNPVKSAFTVNSVFARFADPKMSAIDKSSILTSKVGACSDAPHTHRTASTHR